MSHRTTVIETPLERLVALLAVAHAKRVLEAPAQRERFPEQAMQSFEPAEDVQFEAARKPRSSPSTTS
jgi:hypothetical protein